LLDAGAVVDQPRTDILATPFYVACQERQLEVAELLLKYGADINVRRKDDGSTPLHTACRKGYLDVVQLLIKMGTESQRFVEESNEGR
jgi:ankyrin repeat protein